MPKFHKAKSGQYNWLYIHAHIDNLHMCGQRNFNNIHSKIDHISWWDKICEEQYKKFLDFLQV